MGCIFCVISATEACSLWVLERKVFHKAMMKAGLQRQEENINFLKSVSLLKSLDRGSLSKMADLLKMVSGRGRRLEVHLV